MRNVPDGVIPLRYVRGLARMPYLAVGDGFLRVYRHGFREPWAIPASDVAVTAPDPKHPAPFLATGMGGPDLRLVLARPYPSPRLAWWVVKADEMIPPDDVDALDVAVRDVDSAVATLAAGGVTWTDDPAAWRLSRGEPPAPLPHARPRQRLANAGWATGAAGLVATIVWSRYSDSGVTMLPVAGGMLTLFATSWLAGRR